MARALGLGVLAWAPLGMGVLTGKYNRGASPPETQRFGTAEEASKNEFGSQFVNERSLQIAAEVVAIAKEIARSPSQVALAWLRQQPGLIIPIVGLRKLSQIEDDLRCLEVTLDSAQLQRLDDISRIELGFPHDFLHSATVLRQDYEPSFCLTFGDTHSHRCWSSRVASRLHLDPPRCGWRSRFRWRFGHERGSCLHGERSHGPVD